MAVLSQTDMQKLWRQVQNLVLNGSGNNSTIVEDGPPTVKGSETNGDTYFDPTNSNLYIFSIDKWILTGDFTWIKYATSVNNKQDDGTVADASDVIGFRDNLIASVNWIGERFNQAFPTESTDPTVYYWRLAPAGLIDDSVINPDEKPLSPINLAITDELYRTNRAGGVKSRVVLTWNNTVMEGVTDAATNVVFYKLTSEVSYTPFGEFSTTTCTIPDLQPGEYDFRVVAASKLGILSDHTDMTGQTIAGLTSPPSNVEGFNINPSNGQGLLGWNLPTDNLDLDVISGGSVQIRHSSSIGSGVTWSVAQVIVESLAGATNSVLVPLLTGTYFIKFIDSTGNESVTASVITSTFEPPGFNFLQVTNEEVLGFAGTKTNCTVVNGELVLDSNQDSMTYDFASPIDLRTVQTTRVSPTFAGVAEDANDRICNVVKICDRMSMCSEDVSLTVEFFVSTTDDDPSDSDAVYTPFVRLITRDIRARGLKFRVVLNTVTDGIIQVSNIGMKVDVPDVLQTGSVNVTDTTNDTTVDFGGPFYEGLDGLLRPTVNLQLVGATQGDEALLVSKSSTGIVVAIYNNGARVTGTIDYQAIGT